MASSDADPVGAPCRADALEVVGVRLGDTLPDVKAAATMAGVRLEQDRADGAAERWIAYQGEDPLVAFTLEGARVETISVYAEAAAPPCLRPAFSGEAGLRELFGVASPPWFSIERRIRAEYVPDLESKRLVIALLSR